MKKKIVAPEDLSSSSQGIYAALVAEYGIADRGGLEILRSGLKSLDSAEAAEAAIKAAGLVTVDRFGQPKANPLCAVARDARAQWLSALRALNLAVGEAPKIGRPGAHL